eukprot:2209360-Pleurochrysis_carterae.AAC.1
MPRRTYDELIAASERIVKGDAFEELAIGCCAAISWRKTAGDTWCPCVIERTASDSFSVWSKD